MGSIDHRRTRRSAGFHPDEQVTDVFKIAWIGGSEMQSIGDGVYTFLPM